MMKVYGRVYLITNMINNKKYVGVTTKSLSERFKSHLYRANHEKSLIQRAMKKYGSVNFTIVEIDSGINELELFEKETKWIAELNTFNGHGYNQTAGGGGITNMSQELRDRISKTKTGKKVPKLCRKKSKEESSKISSSLGGGPIKGTHRVSGAIINYDYITQAKKDGFNPSLVCAVIKGHRPHHKDYVFSYVKNANPDLIAVVKSSAAVQRIASDPVEKQSII